MDAQTHSEPQGAAPAHGTTCEWCSGAFVARRRWARFCGTPCRNAFHRASAPAAVKEARELVRLALEGCDPTTWNPRARKLLGIR